MRGRRKRLSVTEDFKTRSVAVVDNGIYGALAQKLSETFGKVFYTSPWVADYPVSSHTEVAEGFSDFERVDDIWGIVDDVDLFVFPDSHQGPLQEYLAEWQWPYTDELGEHLEKHGKRVWGSRRGDELELYREEARAYFKTLDIPQPPYEVVSGMTALRNYIKSRDKEKLWIKISRTRGDTETFSVEGYDLSKNRLDELDASLGPVAEYRDFIVEEDLPDTLDLAIDTYSIDGKFPSRAMLGNEKKDQGYVCVVKDWADMPPKMTEIYEKLTPALKGYQYRNFLALECRTGKNGMWLSDPCCRAGSPVSELEMNMIGNLAEIMWQGADGVLVDPEYKGKYGFEVIVQSPWVDDHPLKVEFPAKFRDQIKLRYASQFPDGTWIMPQKAGPVFGTVVAYGDNLDDCFAEVEEIGSTIKGTQIEVCMGSMEGLKQNLKELASIGIQF